MRKNRNYCFVILFFFLFTLVSCQSRRANEDWKGDDEFPDLRGKEVTREQLKNYNIKNLTYDSITKWIDIDTDYFDPMKNFNDFKKTPYGYDNFETSTIPNSQITIAIIDQSLNSTDLPFKQIVEYNTDYLNFNDNNTVKKLLFQKTKEKNDNFKELTDDEFYKEMYSQRNSMHGYSVSSLLADSLGGTFPEGKIAYFVWDTTILSYKTPINVINHIIDYNKEHVEKIRIISISDHFQKRKKYWKEFIEAIEKAEDNDIFVVGCFLNVGGFRQQLDLEIEVLFPALGNEKFQETIYFPTGNISIGDGIHYPKTFYARGGASWIPPYLSGLIGKCLAIDPTIGVAEMYEIIEGTCEVINGNKIVNPKLIIEEVGKIGER